MKLDFTKCLNRPKEQFDFTFEWNYDENMFDSVPHTMLSAGVVEAKFSADEVGVVTLRLEARIPFKFVCDKCADEFERNLFIEAEEKIEPESDDAEGFTYDSNGEVDIDYIVKEIILSSFPQSVLCSPDCKGLCPSCGVNLNYDACDCSKNKVGKNNPFGELLGKIQ